MLFTTVKIRTVLAIGILLTAAWPAASKTVAGVDPPDLPKRKKNLLSPMVDLQSRRARIIHLQDLRAQLYEYLSATGNMEHVSVYVEDLNTGVWLGINERKPLRVASLLKVGVMMMWLKWDMERPGVLEKKIRVRQKHMFPNEILSAVVDTPLTIGDYTVMSLIEKMILSSDNTAVMALREAIPDAWLKEAFEDVGIPSPYTREDKEDTGVLGKLSAKQYAQLLKALYNASYLDPPHSEMALRFLIKTKHQSGIRAILPKGVVAAMKYGLLTDAVHESGIVYNGSNPYLISIFTYRYSDVDKDASKPLEVIRGVGSIVHNFFKDIDRQK